MSKLHYDQSHWGENASEFYPERFAADKIHEIHPYSLMTFSKGQRNCLGGKYAVNTIKVLLVYLIRRFKFTTALKFSDLRYEYNITAFVANQPLFQIQRR